MIGFLRSPTVVIPCPMIAAPFVDQPVHVVESPRVCFLYADFSCRATCVTGMPAVFVEFYVFLTKRPSPLCTCPGGVFPFNLGW